MVLQKWLDYLLYLLVSEYGFLYQSFIGAKVKKTAVSNWTVVINSHYIVLL